MNNFLATAVERIRLKKPLVHHITNYVTVNDTANVTLAIGGSPIMADDINEVAEITAISSSLLINIGTLNKQTISSMILAGKTANDIHIPVVLDPVGAGASTLRTETTKKLLSEINFAVIKGNISEIRTLAGFQSETKGVDASDVDSQQDDSKEVAKKLARETNSIVAITGKTDIVTDGQKVILIKNGTTALSKITGSGCMSGSLVATFCATFPDKLLEATAKAIMSMGIAGQRAFIRTKEYGTGSFHIALIDEISKLNGIILEESGDFDEE